MNYFRELKVWKKAMDLVTEVYKNSENFPKEEIYGLRAQIRRSAISIPSNIAEGCGRDTSKDFNRFLGIALGSCFELETQLMVGKKLKYIPLKNYKNIEHEIQHIQNMIIKLQKSLA